VLELQITAIRERATEPPNYRATGCERAIK
jgi:hypothetical protein